MKKMKNKTRISDKTYLLKKALRTQSSVYRIVVYKEEAKDE